MKKVYKAHILFTKEKDRFEVFENGYVAVGDDGRVVGVANSLEDLKVQFPAFFATPHSQGENVQRAEFIDFGDKLLIPAMNDMHVHAPQVHNQGVAMDLELLPWLQNYTFPEESKYADVEYAERMYRRFMHTQCNLFFASSKFSYYLILLITVPIIVETSQILHLWLGDNVPEHTVSFVRLILFTSWVSCFANPTSVIIYATGKMRKFTAYVSGLNLAIVPVAYLFLKLGCEPESTMIVSLAITILAQAVRFYILRGMVDIPVVKYLKGVLFPSLLVTLLSFTVPLFLHNISITNTIFFITICFISCLWTAIIIFLCGVNKQERKLITEKIWSVIKK